MSIVTSRTFWSVLTGSRANASPRGHHHASAAASATTAATPASQRVVRLESLSAEALARTLPEAAGFFGRFGGLKTPQI